MLLNIFFYSFHVSSSSVPDCLTSNEYSRSYEASLSPPQLLESSSQRCNLGMAVVEATVEQMVSILLGLLNFYINAVMNSL